MKRLLLLISFIFLFLYSFTQTDVQRDNRVSPILKQALASTSGYYIYGRTGTAGFINIAVLNQLSNTLCWFTCHGRLFDSTKLTAQEFEQVTSKQIEPFVLYQNICNKYLADIAAAKNIYRAYGDIQLLDKLNGNYRALFAMETVESAKTPLQKLIAIENVRKKILTQLVYLNCVSPFGLQDDPLYKISKEQAGAMIQTKDSTVYYNIDPTSAVAKIILYKKSARQLYIQNRFSEVIDSVAIQPEKYDLLQKEKTDVFLLYRGWLELQWQGALAAIKRQSSGLYSQVNAPNEKEVKELYSQLNAIGAKINQLNSPEAKSIEQAIYETYNNETSEINYIPLLGIGYNLTQTRGQKEYELTNHLGNVLATVSDKKIGVSSITDSSLIDHYEPDIVSAQDYYPFGMLQPGRSYLSSTGGKYRYGFNGKENDSEVKGEGNQQDYGMRIYDPRLGRFLSVDPLTGDYPWYTPYQFAGNKPINSIDLDGLEPVEAVKAQVNQGPAVEGAKIGGKFINGAVNTAFATIGAFTEIPAAGEYGDKVQNKEQAFPLTHGDIKYTAANALAAPAILAKKIKEDPSNPELWGEASMFVFPFAISSKFRYKESVRDAIDPMTAEMSQYNGAMPKLSEFAWQNNKAMNDIISKSIHGNVYNKKGIVGEVGFELENGVITPKALGRNLTTEAKAHIINVGKKQMQSPGFNVELLEKVNEALNSGQIPTTTNRYQKLLQMRDILTPKPPTIKK